MTLSTKQTGVAKGMAAGMTISLALVLLGIVLNPLRYPDQLEIVARVELAATLALLPAGFVFVSVARLAKHRFFTPEDIDGGGLTTATARAKVLQSLLQNTLEQAVLAVLVFTAWAVLGPGTWLSVVVLAAGSFALGRMLFFVGYERGAPARALGFTLSFYPAVLMLLVLVGHLVWSSLTS